MQTAVGVHLSSMTSMTCMVDSVRNYRLSASRIQVLEEQLARVPKHDTSSADHSAMNAAQHTLFTAAQRLRMAWLCSHKSEAGGR